MNVNTSLFIHNGRIKTMKGQEFIGSILVEGTRIKAMGEELVAPEGAKVIEAEGKLVLPGFIDAHCHVGLGEEIYQHEGDDLNEMTEPVTPELRAIDGINPEDEGFRDARLGGVTTVFSTPGSGNVIGGTGVVLKTAGKVVDKMVLREPAGLKVAFGENPKAVYGAEQKKMPMTRMATASLLRQALVDAETYLEKLEQGIEDPEKFPERDLGMESMIRVIKREIPLRAHAHRADDIMTAIRIAQEFNVDLIIEHCTEGHKIADVLAEYGYPAVVGPVLVNRAKVELKDKSFETPGILTRAGVKVAIITDHSVTPIEQLPLCAALVARAGMDEEEALKAITINPAEILGVDDRVGSLEVGKDADIVLWSEHPFVLKARPETVIINGQVITD
ncbi:amidohydrolase, imidazolonepropionase [Desulfitobacterium dichloroeliminans LMG P-21439]|uniref:Amidohydrolase, imidazolonepropionase n=1 Tax=Desulfitobacterium dichloroeliminans (strain LMG P-21439 / DCA1) TaxID=871963 RepID=L0F678_DESDL|nr:amidohydrolase [Desulfitobacterium dichloroeliminans]AGA68687.1 amidohydrolase, imidazolonepropionase [Desulfitobacterium dichloroeliminans LMG P-21439]